MTSELVPRVIAPSALKGMRWRFYWSSGIPFCGTGFLKTLDTVHTVKIQIRNCSIAPRRGDVGKADRGVSITHFAC
jgi:hypothetical protein